MLKRFCDRCGKRVGDKWYNINIIANDTELPNPMIGLLAGCNSVNIRDIPPKKDYCQACMDEFNEFLKDKK